jgi:predicted MFS family arabinose efflux permease
MSAADASPPRRTLMLVGLASTAALALQALPGLHTAVRLLLVVGVAFAAAIGSGARWGLLTEIVPTAAFPLARSTMNVAVGAFQVVGFAVGGLLLTALSTTQVFALAALVSAAGVALLRLGLAERAPRRAARAGLRETLRGNRVLWSRRDTRVLLVALCVPNGLVVGCEALFVPYAGEWAAWLLVAGALGMMAGDLVVGRFLTPAARRRSDTALRMLLGAPFLVFVLGPPVPVATVLVAVATVGYAASLAQQEWLVALTPPEWRGQVLGVESAVRMTGQGVFAALAGALGDLLPPGTAMTVLAVASLAVSLALGPGLRRAADRAAASRVG